MVVYYYYEAMCLLEKLVHYLQCQGHSEGLCGLSTARAICTFSSKLLVCLQLIFFYIQHHKLECPVEKWDYCVQDQGHSDSSKC